MDGFSKLQMETISSKHTCFDTVNVSSQSLNHSQALFPSTRKWDSSLAYISWLISLLEIHSKKLGQRINKFSILAAAFKLVISR